MSKKSNCFLSVLHIANHYDGKSTPEQQGKLVCVEEVVEHAVREVGYKRQCHYKRQRPAVPVI